MNNFSDEKFWKSWTKLTTPDTLKKNLTLASLYITAYETLKNTIVNRIKDFFIFRFNENGEGIPDVEYDNVKKLHKNILIASCQWLQQNGAINAEDMTDIMTVRKHRNQIAHQLTDILIDIDQEINLSHLEKIRYLLQKIDRWWIREVDIPINSNFDGFEVKDEDIQSGRMILIDLIIGIALEDQNTASKNQASDGNTSSK
jgi:hypothetical protein